jgi:hypothetical protein
MMLEKVYLKIIKLPFQQQARAHYLCLLNILQSTGKSRVSKSSDSKNKKKDKDVVINIYFMEWSLKDQELKKSKKGKKLPGSKKESFSLTRYQEEIGKYFKRITTYL